jgi:hypothetical protein
MDKTLLVLGIWVVWTGCMLGLGFAAGRSEAYGKISREWARISQEWLDLLEATKLLK